MMKNQLVLATAMAFGVAFGACSTSPINSSNAAGAAGALGASGSGNVAGALGAGGGSNGGSSACSGAPSCGGNVLGKWTVHDSCLTVSGAVDVTGLGLNCSVQTSGTLSVQGTWTANANGTYTDGTTTSGNITITAPKACLSVSGTTTTCDRLDGTLEALGYRSVTCSTAAGGEGCTCAATVQQVAGLGVLNPSAETNGNYVTASSTLTNDGSTEYAYCVSGANLTLSPQGVPTLTGSMSLAADTGNSSGGSSGSDGSGGGAGGVPSGGVAGAVANGGGGSGAGGAGGAGGSGGATGPKGPCDIYESAKTPCVGAYSTVRALYGAYKGNLYQVRRTSDKTTKDVPILPGGYADSSVQDAFCTGACTISILYDQSPQHNDMPVSGITFWLKTGGTETDAKAAKISAGGHPVYGVKSFGGKGNSYRAMKPKGTATGDQAEAMYEVVDSKVFNASCCNDFGNAETTGNPDGAATMEAIYWGNATLFGSGGGSGPWLLADLEAGTFGGESKDNPANTSLITPAFATLLLNGFSGNRYAMKGGDSQTGALTTKYDGKRPAGYTPMKKQGAIVLGAGGDGSFYSTGVFFEGAITIGCPDDKAVDDAIQANIVAAGYGK